MKTVQEFMDKYILVDYYYSVDSKYSEDLDSEELNMDPQYIEKITGLYNLIIVDINISGDGTCYEPESEIIKLKIKYDKNPDILCNNFNLAYQKYRNDIYVPFLNYHFNVIDFINHIDKNKEFIDIYISCGKIE
jgi:hypothetical protein